MAEAARTREARSQQTAMFEFNQKPLKELLALRTELYSKLSDEFVDILLENNIELEKINPELGMQENIELYIERGKIDKQNAHLRHWLEQGVIYETLESAIHVKESQKVTAPVDTLETPPLSLESITPSLGEIILLKKKLFHLSTEKQQEVDSRIEKIQKYVEKGKMKEALLDSQTLLSELQSEELHFHEKEREQFESKVKLVLAQMDLQEKYENKFAPHQKQQILNLIHEGEKYLMVQNYEQCHKIADQFLHLVEVWTAQFQTQELPALKIVERQTPPHSHSDIVPPVASPVFEHDDTDTFQEDAWFEPSASMKFTQKNPVPNKPFRPLAAITEFFRQRQDKKEQLKAAEEQEIAAFLERIQTMDIYTLRNYIQKIFKIFIGEDGTFAGAEEKKAMNLLKSTSKEAKIFQGLYLEFIKRRTEIHKAKHYAQPVAETEFIKTPRPSSRKKRTSP